MATLQGSDDVAIIGMSCRVAGAESPSELWDLLATSRDVRKEINRFNSAGFYKASGAKKKGLTNVRHAYLLDHGIDRFDNEFFAVPASEAVAMDPQQRLLLELSYEAVENAGITLKGFQGTDTAVYCGLFTSDYGTSLLRDVDATPKYHSTGTSNSIAANRISYFYDLHGPSMVIDTACSSTMVALHQAVLSLKAGGASMALVCGANLILNPDMFIHMSELGFLSPDGKCKSFDSSGDGYGRGEGVLALLLKPLNQAIKDKDPIRSVIRGTRINQDGRTNGITLPSSEAQTSNLKALYKNHGLFPGDVQYIEAHGTGTSVGDPLEMSAINSVFANSERSENLVVGSIKSNVGHLEACAAIAGIIKTVECLERAHIPPQMHFVNPNQKINFSGVTIPTTMKSWPDTGSPVRRAAVNSFGFGGTNGHVVLDHYPTMARIPVPPERLYLFKISAATEAAVGALALSYADYIERRKPSLGDLAHTLLSRRSTMKKSLFLSASTHSELISKLRDWKIWTSNLPSSPNVENHAIGFVFTGQGAQWPEMGKQLLSSSRIFAAVIDECDKHLASLGDGPAWKISDELCKPPKLSKINISSFSQPLCTALQLGLIEIWREWGVVPRAVLGHSSGEVAAAFATGILSLRDAIVVAYYRGLYMSSDGGTEIYGPKGAMCAVGMGKSQCKDLLRPFPGRAVVAAINSTNSCTISGDEDAIIKISEIAKDRGFFCRVLRVDMAYHSHHMLPLAPAYEKSLRDAGVSPLIPPVNPTCQMYSSVTEQELSPSVCTPAYWALNMTSPVQFAAALEMAMKSQDLGVLVEIGPHPALKGPVMDTLAAIGSHNVIYFGSCIRNKPAFDSMLDTVGSMISTGLKIDTEAVNSMNFIDDEGFAHGTGRVLTDLPSYQWDHSVSHWAETRVSRNQRFREFPRHQLLGARIASDTPLSPAWRNILILTEIDWLEEIIATGEKSMPKSAFISMALEAARQFQVTARPESALLRFSDIRFLKDLPLSILARKDGTIETYFSLQTIAKSQDMRFTISAATLESGDVWEEFCCGCVSFTLETNTMPDSSQAADNDPTLLKSIKSSGLFAEPQFDSFSVNGDRASGDFSSSAYNDEHYFIDPLRLSSLMQIPAMLMTSPHLVAEHQLDFIEVLELPASLWSFRHASFDARLYRYGPIRGSCNMKVFDSEGHFMVLKGMWSKVSRSVQSKVPLQSLFYKPEVLPDISFLKSAEPLSIARAIEMMTHKWPMSDIGLAGLSASESQVIHSSLRGLGDHERPRFRSLTVKSEDADSDLGRLRTVKAFNKEKKFHMLLSSAEHLSTLDSYIRNEGFACVRVQSSSELEVFEQKFDKICNIEGFESQGWIMGRSKRLSNGVAPTRSLKILGCEGSDANPLRAYTEFEYIRIDKCKTAQFCEEQKARHDQFDLIILDGGQKSMLVDWAGNDLLPWIQAILEQVGNLLWVSYQPGLVPFKNVAGGFVRTIQSEHPSIKAASLVIQDGQDASSTARTIFEVFDTIVHGSNETEALVCGQEVFALRYVPDDDLSASIGVVPASTPEGQLGCNRYELSLVGPRSLVVLSSRSSYLDTPPAGSLHVSVEASIIDPDDTVLFADIHPHRRSWTGLGKFFMGSVRSKGNSYFRLGELVVGWHHGAHNSMLQVPSCQLHHVPQGIPPTKALTHYAAYAMAFAIVHGTARARKNETIDFKLPQPLSEALMNVCSLLGIGMISGAGTEADFLVMSDSTHGLMVNRRTVSIKDFMASNDSDQWLDDVMLTYPVLQNPVPQFSFQDLQNAFDIATLDPGLSVLIHGENISPERRLLTHNPTDTLFRPDGAYMVIGGLGGLGRYLMAWMVQKGARHLVTISRSGLDSPDANSLIAGIEALGAEIQVYKADARNGAAVNDVMTEVRKTRPIRGCFNMVLVLENSPFMTMKGQQWDKVVRSKVDSTWNMHEATLSDTLDFFIMLSSISSISGNRTQANYATGNCFQNALADYRRSLGLPGLSIALGPMSGIGVLAEDHDLLRTLSQSGLKATEPHEFTKIMEAAVLECQLGDRSLLSVGFEMFETLDGVIQSRPEQNQLFWTEWAEFGFLFDHRSMNSGAAKNASLREQLQAREGDLAKETLLQAFLHCLSNILGYDSNGIDSGSSLASYGVDSLNAVSCRYWFFKELDLDVPIFDILGCRSINELIQRVFKKLQDQNQTTGAPRVPQPSRSLKDSLSMRPISRSQSRLWFLHRFLPDKTIYNLLLACHISGTVNVELFTETWSIFVQRHEILHSKLVNTRDGLQQLPKADPTFSMMEVETTEMMFQQAVESITDAARSHVFDLESGDIIRGWLLRSPQQWRFFLASHHLAWDRTSVPTIFDEITSIYKSLANGEPGGSSVSPVPYQFIDYTLWQEAWMAEPELIRPHMEYWKSQLDGIPESVSLFPTALVSKRPPMKQYEVHALSLDLDASLTTRIKAFCKMTAVTPFMFMASALTALIHRFTGDLDIVIGIADGDRGHTEFDRLVGFTVNMLAIRSRVSKDMPFMTLLEDYRSTCLEGYEHRALPFDYLLQQLEIPRRTSHSPVFQVTINYQMQGAFQKCDFGDFEFTAYDHYNAKSQSDWMLDVEETMSGELHCVFSFDASLYDNAVISGLASAYKVLIESILSNEGQENLENINLVTEEDETFIASVLQPSFIENWPSLEDPELTPFQSLFNNAVSARPSKPAIIDDSRTLTWSELDDATHRVARLLNNFGAQPGESLGICCEGSIDMIIAMYGIVRLGCVYVPIDPDFPEERMSYMLEDCKVKHVLVDGVDGKSYQRLIACGIPSINIHVIGEIATANELASAPILDYKKVEAKAFCCIFTSGSTGRPKGIYLGHTQLRHQMEGYHARIGTNMDDRLLLSSAMVFDMSLTSVYGTVLHGATMVVASREARYNPAKMVAQLVERRISNCTFTTTQLKVLLTAPNRARLSEWKSLRSMVVGGEQIPPWVVRDFHGLNLPEASIYNGYGPAETTVCNSLRRLLPEDAKKTEIPLGRPLNPSRFHILDEKLRPVPVGVSGELYIGGPTVNEGYVNREDLTATVFLRDPLATPADIENGMDRLYRTGDSFRLMRDGTIQSLGRIGGQRQVKIRGMRTELDEIESVIYDACQVVEDLDVQPVTLVAVVYHRTSKDEGVLAAYLAFLEDGENDDKHQASLKAYLRLRLKAVLPVHMIPSAFVFLSRLPQMVSGKIDYKTLLTWDPPAPETSSLYGTHRTPEPLSEVQSVIASVWKDVLEFDGELSSDDEFFALGGHSLILLQIQDGIHKKFGATIPLADMFADPTIEGMEKLVLAKWGSDPHITHQFGRQDAAITVTAPDNDQPYVDWDKEGSLVGDADWYAEPCPNRPVSVVAITGACTMAGAHFIHHVLSETEMKIHCIATEAPSDDAAYSSVIDALKHWQLFEDIPAHAFERLVAYRGTLSHPTLGLTKETIKKLDREVHAIYQLDSEVSLMKRYENLRDSNVGSLRFLISLAHGEANNTKSIHYLSTWGVPHLQAWNKTELLTPEWLTTEVEMTNMKPGADGSLGYLKARWACESLLYHAAQRGIPINIFRSCMCGGSPASGVPLARTDINRRILEGSLQVGLVPDFSSERGGGMSWITADFLIKSILHLSQSPSAPTAKARIHHIVSDKHIPYLDLPALLDVSYAQEKMRTVRPAEWFKALKACGNPEMTMQAEVLESWCLAGWVPFRLEAKGTLELLKKEKGLVPPRIGREELLRLVVGKQGF